MSIIEIFCVAVAELPEESVATQVTIVSPNENTDGASTSIKATPTISSAVAIPSETTLDVGFCASMVISAGGVIDGTVVSITDIV